MRDVPLAPNTASVPPAAQPSYFRTQTAPFVFGVAVGGIWFWQRYIVAVALNPETHPFTVVSTGRVVAIALGVLAAFFVWPAAVAVWSTIGDARFWGAGVAAHARAWWRLVSALAIAFALGGGVWLLQAFAPYWGNPSDMLFAVGYYLSPYPVSPFAPMVAGFALLIGVLAAFTFARWPLPATRYVLLTQMARWIAVGVLAAAGAFVMDSTLDLAEYVTGIVALHTSPPLNFHLAMLFRLFGPVVPAAAGGLIGGLLRAGMMRGAPAAPIAPAPAGRRIVAWARGVGAVGTGLLLGACWAGALYLLTLGPSARPATALLLVGLPLLIVALAAWRGRGFWVGSRASIWRRPALRLALAIIAIGAGAAPALMFMLNFSLVNGPILQVLLAAPVLSAGLAIGFAWGRGDGRAGRGWWSAGTRAALLGAVGYSLCYAGLIAYVVITWINLPRPIGTGLGGGAIAFVYYTFGLETLGGSLGASFAFAALGGALGAALRVSPSVE